jgi:hypothetical protein
LPFAVCKTLDVVEDNFGFVLREFMKELEELESEEGMLLDIPDTHFFCIRGTLVSVSADSKGAHEIGGFMSPSAKRFCRLCLIHRSVINFKSNVDQLVLRDYDYDQAVVASNERVCDISQ